MDTQGATYRHSQSTVVPVIVFLVLAAILLVPNLFNGAPVDAVLIIIAMLILVGFVLLGFNRLTVEVAGDEVRVVFRWGWPRRVIDLGTVHRVDVVRNKWWYGFGIRITPHGWLYNVWGLDAVQLNYRDGKAFRIGTDEPEALAEALRARIVTGDQPS